jgi:hypothetical protein
VKFKAKWVGVGWAIHYSHIGIFWTLCTKSNGNFTTYRVKDYAIGIADKLNKGEAPNGWY